ncbi:hypothetical protein APHNP_0532 [Anaplasma phagocytophilum str. ApNP]|uniref:Uncharacterized protein n=1 Tax=Anaplasma phagocytophilum str. ApNP TaxID=1359153 RepID=A0A0F3NGA0_ANAPH|nr:hypothetical protein APHNP_0532 [Anaplasma phagocytophilum str. ApNP]
MSDICWVRVIAGDLIGFLYASFIRVLSAIVKILGRGLASFLHVCYAHMHFRQRPY